MSTPRSQQELSEPQISEINDWLITQKVNILPCRWAREFADATLLAKILAGFYPRYVQLQQYPACNKTELKLANWELLNTNILARLDLQQPKEELEKLSKGTPGAIDVLLSKIMEHRRKHKLNRSWSRISSHAVKAEDLFDGSNPDYITLMVKKEINGEFTEVKQKMIAYELYEEALDEIREKSHRIERLKREEEKLQYLIGHARDAIDNLYHEKERDFLINLASYQNSQIFKTKNAVKHESTSG